MQKYQDDKLDLSPGGVNYASGARPFREILDNVDAAVQAEAAKTATPTAPATNRSVSEILAERGKTHGDFTDNAFIMQRLKDVMHQSKNWTTMTDVQREALHMIVHKVGRICSGDPNINDHWDDIAGYAKLASERI